MSFLMACSVTLSRAAIFRPRTCLFFCLVRSVDSEISSVDHRSIS